MNWFKQTLANVAGTQEPEYGPSAIQSVSKQAETTAYTELTKDDLKWKAMESTNVETQTFYMMTDEGKVAMAQIIYSNVGGLRVTVQFNLEIFHHTGTSSTNHLWCSDPLENYGFDEEMVSFYADGVAITLNEAGDEYSIKSARNESSLVDLTFKRNAPGFQVGENGTTYFGTDPANPWGEMRHRFWPRCAVTGTIKTPEKTYDMKGKGLFIHALQGMKPHHLAAKWNFVNIQTATYSALIMEYTTPLSYGNTTVNVGGITTDQEIIFAGATNKVTHTASKEDEESFWPVPTDIEFKWNGKTKGGKDISAVVSGSLSDRLDRVDVMAHVPGLLKSLVGGVVGTRPYIYQFSPQPPLSLSITLPDSTTPVTEEGVMFSEATFIS
ncbi:putative survival factor 1 [Phaeomoniella chlamydospora]|uniref:Ceramide-binding protein SVF1 n=1 Tax=Phaeomoniella chlamydospora TaxID=158046 RepID=A0A0G2F080_PHACM|nr:putative survival factor 1 [Phaeomoniella chlamydospora]